MASGNEINIAFGGQGELEAIGFLVEEAVSPLVGVWATGGVVSSSNGVQGEASVDRQEFWCILGSSGER